jgi:predicted  nucleic acid-binding Zn-ribbon protein
MSGKFDSFIEWIRNNSGIVLPDGTSIYLLQQYIPLLLIHRGTFVNNKYVSPNFINVLLGLMLGYCFDNNICISITKGNVEDIGTVTPNSLASAFGGSLPEGDPLRGGVTGACPIDEGGLKDLTDQINKLKKQVDAWMQVARKEIVNPRNNVKMRRVDNTTPEPKQLDEYVSQLESDYANLKKQLETGQTSITAWQEEKAKLEKRIAELDKELKDVNGLYNPLLANYNKLKDDFARLAASQRDTDALKQELEKAKNDLANLNKAYEELKLERNELASQLQEANTIIAQYESDLEKIMIKVTEVYNNAEKLKSMTTKTDAVSALITELENAVATIFDQQFKKEVEINETVEVISQKIKDEFKPELVQADIEDAINQAVYYARKNEDFYYKLVDDINRMLADSAISPLSGRGRLLGEYKANLTSDIMLMLNNINDLIKNYGIVNVDGKEHDRLNDLIDKIKQVRTNIDKQVVETTRKRQNTVEYINKMASELDAKIKGVNSILPIKQSIIDTLTRKIKEMQLMYLSNASQAVKAILRKLYANREII